MQKLKRGLVSLLVLVMVLSLLPVTALANADTTPSAEPEAVTETAAVPVEDSQEAEEDAAQSEIAKSDLPSVQSMLPLEEKALPELDLTGYLPDELAQFPVAKLLDMLGLDKETPGVWARYSYWNEDGVEVPVNDNFVVYDAKTGTIDLTVRNAMYDRHFTLELICGAIDQLDPANTRYIVDGRVAGPQTFFDYSFFNQDEAGARGDKITTTGSWLNRTGKDETRLAVQVSSENWTDGDKTYFGLALNDKHQDMEIVKVLEGFYTAEDSIPSDAKDITDDVRNDSYLADFSYDSDTAITVIVKRNGSESTHVIPFAIYLNGYTDHLTVDLKEFNNCALFGDKNGERKEVAYTTLEDNSSSFSHSYAFMLNEDSGFTMYSRFYFSLYVSSGNLDDIEKAVLGSYESAEDIPSNSSDIKDALFSNANEAKGGYGKWFSTEDSVTFTIVDKDEAVHHVTIRVVHYKNMETSVRTDLPSSTYFKMQSAYQEENKEESGYNAYVMPGDADSYYENGYQTVFLLNKDNTPVTDKEIYPVFTTHTGVKKVFASIGGSEGVEQTNGATAVPFVSGDSIQYSAAANGDVRLANYWVTFLTQQSGPKLFVNAANDSSHYVEAEVDGVKQSVPQREVFLAGNGTSHHDVFFANIGDQPITGLYVELKDAKNVALDDYWTVGKTTTLAAFTTTAKTTSNGELANMGKVRLVPATDEDGKILSGEISGTLVIGYKNGTKEEKIVINLTGTAGAPRIITDGSKLHNGVKYVPYSVLIQTNNMHGDDTVKFSLVAGKLPDGLKLYPSGEIYGVPTKVGKYAFTVKAVYEGDEDNASTMDGTIIIEKNTNRNVLAVNDSEYGHVLIDSAPDRINLKNLITKDGITYAKTGALGGGGLATVTGVMYEGAKAVFLHSEGPLGDLMKVFIDGKLLKEGVDYDTESGSTRVYIREATLKDLSNGTHTIALEFREGGSEKGDMKTTSQNITIVGSDNGGTNGSSSNSSSGSKDNGKATIDNGDGTVITTVTEVVTVGKLSSADKALLDALLNGRGDAGVYMDISAVVMERSTGKILRYLTETPSPLKVTVDVPQAMLDAQKDGKFIYAVRIHDGKAEFLDTTIRGGKATFSSDKFSTYALVTMDQRVAGVKTGDAGVTAYVLVAFVAVAAGAGVVAVRKRKENYTK